MPKFSNASKARLYTCHDDLQRLFNKVIEEYDCSILEGHRPQELQEEYFRTGKSKVRWPNGKHNSQPSKAVDVAPWPIDWNDTNRFYHFGGYVKGVAQSMGIEIRWGGDWDGDTDLDDQTFMDLVHFELVN